MRYLVTICAVAAICFTVSSATVEAANEATSGFVSNPVIDAVNLQLQRPQAQPAPVVVTPGNFHVIVPGRVYRGARPTTEGQIAWLHRIGVRTIIDLQGADPWIFSHAGPLSELGELVAVRQTEAKWAYVNHILWLNTPMSSVEPVVCHEAREINQILDIIRNPKYQPVYFHCEHGEDRTGLIAALYQVFYEKPALSPRSAYQIMEQDGHNHHSWWKNEIVEAMSDYFKAATTAPMSLHKYDNYRCGSDNDFIPAPVVQQAL